MNSCAGATPPGYGGSQSANSPYADEEDDESGGRNHLKLSIGFAVCSCHISAMEVAGAALLLLFPATLVSPHSTMVGAVRIPNLVYSIERLS